MTIARAIFLVEIATSAFSSGPAMAANAPPTTTTIYVGTHFEVRDYDVPVKYVFNGDSRVARITGSLAATPLIQRFRIRSGWNILSLALSVTNVLSQITNLFPVGASPSMVVHWDDANSAWLPLAPGENLAAGAILWLQAENEAALTLVGMYEDPTNRLVNAIGSFLPSAGFAAWDLRDTLSNNPSATAWAYDSSVAQWLAWLPPPLPAQTKISPLVASGSALFVRAAQQAEFDLPSPSSIIHYYHEDHQGSSSVITDSDGGLVEELAYFPFGSCRNRFEPGSVSEPYGFTQKERDRESGLHYFEARFLATPVSRFLTPDSKYSAPEALPDSEFNSLLAMPQALNLYAYVMNNPVVHTDPTGLDAPKPSKRDSPPKEEPTSSTVTLTIVDNDPKNPQSIEIPVSSVTLQPQTQLPGGNGSGSGKPRLGEIVITKKQDEFSTELWKKALSGKFFQATITFKGPDKAVYLKVNLKDAVISSTSIGGKQGDLHPNEVISINAVSMEFFRPDPQPQPEPVGYDLALPQRHP
jgi:RHS repeat-associated protein